VVVAGAAGMAFEVVQPDHAVTQTVPDGSCTFSWWRSALGGARYRIRCDATKPLELSSFKLLSGPAGVDLVEAVEDWGQRPWEDQRPMSGQTITVNAGRDWTYNGTTSKAMPAAPATTTPTAVRALAQPERQPAIRPLWGGWPAATGPLMPLDEAMFTGF
jgi:hypothetical protein